MSSKKDLVLTDEERLSLAIENVEKLHSDLSTANVRKIAGQLKHLLEWLQPFRFDQKRKCWMPVEGKGALSALTAEVVNALEANSRITYAVSGQASEKFRERLQEKVVSDLASLLDIKPKEVRTNTKTDEPVIDEPVNTNNDSNKSDEEKIVGNEGSMSLNFNDFFAGEHAAKNLIEAKASFSVLSDDQRQKLLKDIAGAVDYEKGKTQAGQLLIVDDDAEKAIRHGENFWWKIGAVAAVSVGAGIGGTLLTQRMLGGEEAGHLSEVHQMAS